MSYDIMNYAFLALPADKVCESLEYGVEVPLVGDGVVVVIDEKFSALTHGFIETFAKDWECSSLEKIVDRSFLETRSFGPTGPRNLFTRLMLMSAGITDPVFYKDDFMLMLHFSFGVRFLPVGLVPVTRGSSPCEFGLVHTNNDVLSSLIKALASDNKLTIIDVSNESFSDEPRLLKASCLKTALEGLLAMHAESTGDWDADNIQGCMQTLLDKYLESKECYCDIDVTSTLHRNCHDSGGLDDGVYVVYGNCSPYDEDGWTDPREEDPDTLAEARTHLLGDNSKLDWEKFTPKFGG